MAVERQRGYGITNAESQLAYKRIDRVRRGSGFAHSARSNTAESELEIGRLLEGIIAASRPDTAVSLIEVVPIYHSLQIGTEAPGKERIQLCRRVCFHLTSLGGQKPNFESERLLLA
tara:strand:- start:1577 stop:1927 length:351 start_codon:yes stop_codon:yes gene_type:complete